MLRRCFLLLGFHGVQEMLKLVGRVVRDQAVRRGSVGTRAVSGAASIALATALAAPAGAVSWVINADGNWNVPANWSTGRLPGIVDYVLIDVGGPTVRRITHNSGTTEIRSLTSAEDLWVTGGTLRVTDTFANTANTRVQFGTLRLDGNATLATLVLQPLGTLDGAGTVTVLGTANNVGPSLHRGGGKTLHLGMVTTVGGRSTVRLDGGRTVEYRGGYNTGIGNVEWDLDFSDAEGGGLLRNAAGSTMLDQAFRGSIWARFGGAAKFENAGTFRKDSIATGITTIETSFANLGTVEAVRGRIEVIGPLGGPDATTLAGGKWVVKSRSASDFGQLWFHSSSLESLVTNAADITLIGAGARLGLRFGGTSLESAQLFDVTLRRNAANGAIRLFDGASMGFGTADFTNDGIIELSSGPGGGEVNPSIISLGPGLTLVNNGTIFGNGVLSFQGDMQNNGTIRAEQGVLRINSSSTLAGGTLATGEGARLQLSTLLPLTVDRIDHRGTQFTVSPRVITVTSDYFNAGFGEGNSFNANANNVQAVIHATGAGQFLSAAGLSGGDTATPVLALGNRRVGDATPVVVTITNSGTETTLRGAVRTAGAPLLDVTGGNSFMITPGGTAEFSISTAGLGPGAFSGQSVVVANNFANVADQTVSISGRIFRLAQAEVSGPTLPRVVRLGDRVSAGIMLANVAAADGFSEGLVVNAVTTGNLGLPDPTGFIVLAGQSRMTTVAFDTSVAGLRQGRLDLAFGSGGARSSGLDPIAIGDAGFDLSVMVNNRAAPVFTRFGTALAFDAGLGGYVLDLGMLQAGGLFHIAGLGLGNLVLGPADDLSGLVTLVSGGPWAMGSAFDIGLLGAGDVSGLFGLMLDTGQRGRFLGELAFSGKGTNLSDPVGEDRFARLFLLAAVANAQGVVPEPATWAMMIIGFGAVGIAARRRAGPVKGRMPASGH